VKLMDSVDQHSRQVVDQFSRQAVYFAKLPGHEEATQLLLRMAGVNTREEVLDVACGAGAVACAAARVARQVTGIDLTPAMIERAAALQAELGLANLKWHVGDVVRLAFPADHFDVALTRYSLHHFLQPAEVLAEMARVCKANGRVAVADIVLPPEKVAAYDQMERLRDPSHVQVLTAAELHGLMAAAGLVDLRWAGYFFDLELEALLQASFPRPGNEHRVREWIEADVGVDALGIGARYCDGVVRIAYPIAVVVGTKSADPGATADGEAGRLSGTQCSLSRRRC
jgi:ubiquinone/menaquinone biosynthesis C-methylase UbiE